MNRTSAFIELLDGYGRGSPAALSPSDSDLELLSESLELVDSSPLECAALNELQRHTNTQIRAAGFRRSMTGARGLPGTMKSFGGRAGPGLRVTRHTFLE